MATVADDATQRDVQVVKRVAHPELTAAIDRARVTLAVQNLLHNAVRFSPSGSHVEVRLEARPGEIAISVSDEGPGVGPDEQRKVFEKHWRSPRQQEKGSAGLGLGLYLVRQLVSLHGGRVTLDSTPGRGATFTILLPAGGSPS